MPCPAMLRRVNLLLAACVVALALACVVSVCRPVRFADAVARREQVVKERLLIIRAAEEHYCERYGHYTDDWQALVAAHLLPPEAQWIPYADSVAFTLRVSNDVSVSGEPLPLVECEAAYATYLHGLDADQVKAHAWQAERQGRFPGLKFGDINKPNNNATNW